jgi:o-succinylbenzoate---CoA ligase
MMDPLREAARRDPMGPGVEGALAASGKMVTWSWADLDQLADAAALRLSEAGVQGGDGVAILLPPSPEAVVLLHAIPRAGAVCLPLNSGWTMAELARGLRAAGRPRLLLVPGGQVDALRRELPQVGTVAVDEIVPVREEGELLPADPRVRGAFPELTPDTPVAVLLTSGSTGRPRPIPLTHGNLMASARAVSDRLRLDPMDRWMACLSPAHVGGLALLHRATVVGSTIVTRPDFDPKEFLDLARVGELTHVSLVPVMLRRVLEAADGSPAPRGLRCVLLGGARTPGPLLDEALRRRWPISLTYGLTEASSQVATAPPELVRERPGSVGRPLSGVQVKVQGSQGGKAGDGVDGEILVRGPTVVLLPPHPSPGEGADATMRPSVYLGTDGWLHTGDLGRLDEDGLLWVTGRRSDRIITGGVTVEPAEVEEVLLEHPGVSEVAVLGIPDAEWGQRIAALVVPLDPDAPPGVEDLLAFASARLARSRRPRALRIIGSLPRNANGKVDRQRLEY